MIITLLIHRNITQIQENTIKKQTQGKSTSQQQMVMLFVIMQKSCVEKIFAYSDSHHRRKKNKIKTRNEKVETDPAGEWKGSTNFLEDPSGAWPPVDRSVDFLAGDCSYAPMSNYAPAVCLMLSAAINGPLIVDRWDSRLTGPSTSIFHCSLGEHLTHQDGRSKGKKKQPRSFSL